MLTITKKGERGFRGMLTIADKGGEGGKRNADNHFNFLQKVSGQVLKMKKTNRKGPLAKC